MSRLFSRSIRLVKHSHKFVTRRDFDLIIEFGRLRLEEIGQVDGLDERIKEFRRLFERFSQSTDRTLDQELLAIWWTHEDARITYLLPFHEESRRRCGRGTWLPNATAKLLLERAKEAEAEIKRIKEARAEL